MATTITGIPEPILPYQPAPGLVMQNPVYAQRAGKWQFRWLCFLILSFCYEIPLANVTTFYRANPRLFDVATVLGILFILPGLRRTGRLPPIFRVWAYLVAWFTFCAVLWAAVWFPWAAAGKFSIFYAGRYLQGLIVLYLVASIPLDARQKRLLHYLIVVGGIVVVVYAIPEYLRGGTELQLTEEKTLTYQKGVLFSCLGGATYSHIALFSTLSCAMALSLVALPRTFIPRWAFLAIALFVAWPAAFCGSRSGLVGVGLVAIGSLVFVRALRPYLVAITLAAALMLSTGIVRQSTEQFKEKSLSFKRLVDIGVTGPGNTLLSRIGIGTKGIQGYTAGLYQWQGWRLPLFGGGFYAVPHTRHGELFFRRGYGIHSGYLFPLEQGGIVAFVLFCSFLVTCFKGLRRMIRLPRGEDRAFALGMWVFFLVSLVLALPSPEPFLQAATTINLNTYILALYVLATKRTNANVGFRYSIVPARLNGNR